VLLTAGFAGVAPVAGAAAASTARSAPAASTQGPKAKPHINWAQVSKPHGIAYRAGYRPQPAARPASRGSSSTNPVCPGCDPPLLFGGGLPVMGTAATPGEATITPIFWAAPGFNYSPNYENVIDKYIQDVAADSGKSSNVFAVGTQYYQDLLGGAGAQFIQYNVHAGAPINVSDSYPAPSETSGCVPDSFNFGYTACVTDGALRSEVQATLTAHGLLADDAHLYMVFFPEGVQTCVGPGDDTNTACSGTVYCGYHSAFNDNNSPALYANMPYPGSLTTLNLLDECADPWNGPQGPNGNTFADAEISVTSHEANESITDWTGGSWIDATGNEDGDNCALVFGNPGGSTGAANDGFASGTLYNQVINGDHYYTQDEFSNADYASGRGDVNSPTGTHANITVNGCVQQIGPPGIGHLSTDAVIPGTSTSDTVAGLNLGTTTGTAALTPRLGGSPIPLAVTSWLPTDVTVSIPSTLALGTYNLSLTTSASIMTDSLTFTVAKSYTPITPVRRFDTRAGTGGAPQAPIPGGQTLFVKMAGAYGIPASATAVALNVTAVNATGPTYVTVWPDSSNRPVASNLNPSNPNPVPNFDIVSTGSDGFVDFFNAGGSVDVFADIAGYFLTSPTYTPITPIRLFDTRVSKTPVRANSSIAVQARGVDNIPSNAIAVALNVTAVNATAPTYVTVWPDGPNRPVASNLNPANGNPVPNFDIASLGPTTSDGKLDFYNAAGSVDLFADIAGYYTATPTYTPLKPVRLFDTRPNPVRAGQTLSVQVAGVDGVPANATAVAFNVTGVNATTPTYVTVWPDGANRPVTSTLNLSNGNAVPNFDVVSIAVDGKVDLYNAAGSVNLLADIAGYYS
jgi:hypothetical protein